MNDSKRFNGVVISVTAAAAYFLWNRLGNLPISSEFIQMLIGFPMTYGTFKLIVLGVEEISSKWRLLRKFFLGRSYLEGTWVGFYISPTGKPRFFREVIEQDLDSIVIKGRSNDENNHFYARWNSESVEINEKKKKLQYLYRITKVKENLNTHGVAFFDLDRVSAQQAPHKMVGESYDIPEGKSIKSISFKISDKMDVDWEEAFIIAKQKYEVHKDRF